MRPFIRPKISIDECRKILCKNGKEYTDKEIEQIRNDMLVLIEIDYNYFLDCMEKEQEKEVKNSNKKLEL